VLDFYAHVLADQRDEAAETVDEFMFAAQLWKRLQMSQRDNGVTNTHNWQGWGIRESSDLLGFLGADARNRTEDPIITSDVLCQLSYVGSEDALGF